MPLENTLSLGYLFREPQIRQSTPPVLVILHGVGSNERDLFDLAPEFDGRFFVASARAPIRLGDDAFAWYHVDFTPTGPVGNDLEAESSRLTILRFLDELCIKHNLDRGRVIVGGFSQGAIMSLFTALTEPKKIAGAALMSGRLLPQALAQRASDADLRALPIFAVHGTLDRVLPITEGRDIQHALSQLPVDFTYKEYQMPHTISEESFHDIRGWLSNQLDRVERQ